MSRKYERVATSGFKFRYIFGQACLVYRCFEGEFFFPLSMLSQIFGNKPIEDVLFVIKREISWARLQGTTQALMERGLSAIWY